MSKTLFKDKPKQRRTKSVDDKFRKATIAKLQDLGIDTEENITLFVEPMISHNRTIYILEKLLKETTDLKEILQINNQINAERRSIMSFMKLLKIAPQQNITLAPKEKDEEHDAFTEALNEIIKG